VKKFLFSSILLVPVLTHAAGICGSASYSGITAVATLVNKISDAILKPLIFLMFGLATLVFVWGAKDFVGAADDAEARGKGAQQMIWGIVGMVIMISAIALVTIICNTSQVL
jgi:hypothetical protein